MTEHPNPQTLLTPTVEITPGTVAHADVPPNVVHTVLHVGGRAFSPAAVLAPIQVPGYEIFEELGRGGMGVVYKARQKGLNRIVALKMILSGGHAGAADLERFRDEAEIIGRLHHPNIVQVYEVDECEDRPFLSLEYCPDGTLERRLSGKPIPPREAAILVERLAIAMQAAHDAGVVHRDLKPANVLIVKQKPDSPVRAGELNPESPVRLTESYIPKISDFGLAKKLDVHDGHTVSGAIMGTPSYMAPEQASGNCKEVGPAADIYSLGAILYECLTGRPPFVGSSPLDTVMQVMNQEPLPPRMLNRSMDPDLEKIALKCLEKDPAERYGNALELARDLQRYLNGESVSARSVNLLERLQRELAHSQHEAALGPWGAALIVLAGMIVLSHLASSLLLLADWPQTASFWLPRTLLVGLALPVVIRCRRSGMLLPTNPVERLLWAVWVGYLLAFAATVWVLGVMGHSHLEVYGIACVLSGLAWFVMGGYVWGACYLIGLAFMGLAPALASMSGSVWSPFVFGSLWGAVLSLMGLRYRRAHRLP